MEWFVLAKYLLALGVLTALGAPIAAAFFRPLPRRGAAFALPAALVPFTIVVFWVGQLTFGLHTLAVGVAAVLGCAVLAVRTGAAPEWRSVAATYGVFAVGFLVMVAFRAADPGITPAGGEQFLHFGLVNAIERANSLPPEDMWFAGRELKYYYGTQLQVAGLSMLTGTPLRYGFNVGIATFYGMLFVVGYGVAGAIVHRQGHSYRRGGILGAFFVALAGPTTPVVRLSTPYLPDAVAAHVEPAAFGFVADRFNGGDLPRTVADLSSLYDWGWWYTRYVVPGTIQEVPLYSFVKADLHGHTLANGYVLFAGALALAYYATPAAARTRRRAIVLVGLGAVAGLFGFMNTWSLPTAAGLAVLSVAASDAHPATLLPAPWADRLRPAGTVGTDEPVEFLLRELWRLVLAAVAGLAVLLVGIAIASPFLVFGQIPTNDGVGFLPPRSPLGPFLVIYAGLVSLFALYVGARGWQSVAGTDPRWLAVGALTLPAVVAATITVLDFAVLAVLGPLIVAGWLLVRTDRAGFAVVLLVAGAGLLLSFELVHARIPQIANPRWNTSLKVAVQGWTLGAAGAGAAVAVLLTRGYTRLADRVDVRPGATADGPAPAGPDGSTAPGPAPDGGRTSADPGSAWGTGGATTVAWAVVVLLVVAALVASAVFPVLMFSAEIGSELAEDRYNPSIDGLNAAERFHADEYDALRWLEDRPGHPTIVEAPGASYRWTSPAATYSGLPSVVGWAHQKEYRSPEAYERRVNHVDTIYAGEWPDAARNLHRHDVTYVYVGPNERERYGSDLRSFDREAVTVAFEGGAVTIYEVDHTELPESAE
jgi:YYY domain-containing protein